MSDRWFKIANPSEKLGELEIEMRVSFIFFLNITQQRDGSREFFLISQAHGLCDSLLDDIRFLFFFHVSLLRD
ncbi:MAG: hypothetical protein VW057_00035, partial [Rhodospirillaceae bacterium]